MRKLLLTCFVVLLATGLSFAQDTICGGHTHTLQAGNPLSLTNPSYSMNPGGNSSPNGIFVFSPSVTATYTLYTTGKIPPGNTKDTTSIEVIEVVVQPQPQIAVTVTNITCASDTNAWNLNLTWNPTGNVPTYTVSWLPDATTIPVVPPGWGNNATFQRDSAIAAGSYSAVVTSDWGCADTAFFTITSGPAKANFSLSPSPNYTLTGLTNSITVTASSSVTLTYTFYSNSTLPSATSSVVVTNTNLGTWSVSAVHPVSQCAKTETFIVAQNTVAPVSTISSTQQAINCASPAIAVTVTAVSPTVNFTHFITSPPPNLVWSANSTDAVYQPGAPGTYTYVLLNNVTGCRSVKHFTLTSSANFPTFGINSVPANFTVGCGSTATTTINYVNPQSTIPPGGGPTSYTILPPSFTGTLTPPPANLGQVLSYQFTAPGQYTAVIRDMTNFCETKIPFSVVSNITPPVLDSIRIPTRVLDCFTISTVIEAFSSTDNVKYTWSYPSGSGGTSSQATKPFTVQINPFTAPENELIANYTITVTDQGNECITTTTVDMYQNLYLPNPFIAVQHPSITCLTPTVLLTNASSSGIPAQHPLGFYKGLPVSSFYWEGPSPQVPLGNSTTYTALIAGTYTVHVRDMNNGCERTGTVNVADGRVFPIINPLPPVPLGCGADSVALTPVITNTTTAETYTWTGLSNQPILGPTNQASVTPQDTGAYRLIVRNPASGCTDVDTFYVYPDTLTAQIAIQGTNTGYAPFEVTFINESFTREGNSGITTLWSFATDDTLVGYSGFETPKHTYTQPGTYTIVAFASKGLCLDTAYAVVHVEIPSDLVVPNVFTPNGDGVNDLFFLQRSANLSEVSAQIYDRWGNLVYEVTSDTQNIEWDGKNQYGKESPAGSYFYIIKGTGRDGKTYDLKGTLTLIR